MLIRSHLTGLISLIMKNIEITELNLILHFYDLNINISPSSIGETCNFYSFNGNESIITQYL